MNNHKVEDNLKHYFRSLDCYNYEQTFNQIPEIVEGIRAQARGQEREIVFKIYGMLAEEIAHLLLRMYQTQYESEIVENLIFEYEKGKTTEIDLMLLTKNMIYIVECKHRSNDIEVLPDGSFLTDGRTESPVTQNINHIRKLLGNLQYANLIPAHRIRNIVFLLLNGARVKNPVTLFSKGNVQGAFAGYRNLLPLINKFETDNPNGKIPIKSIKSELEKIGKPYEGRQGAEKHLKNLQERYNK